MKGYNRSKPPERTKNNRTKLTKEDVEFLVKYDLLDFMKRGDIGCVN